MHWVLDRVIVITMLLLLGRHEELSICCREVTATDQSSNSTQPSPLNWWVYWSFLQEQGWPNGSCIMEKSTSMGVVDQGKLFSLELSAWLSGQLGRLESLFFPETLINHILLGRDHVTFINKIYKLIIIKNKITYKINQQLQHVHPRYWGNPNSTTERLIVIQKCSHKTSEDIKSRHFQNYQRVSEREDVIKEVFLWVNAW